MALISNIGAGIFTTLKFIEKGSLTQPQTDTEHQAFPSSGTLSPVANVREFPAFGAPANIVNVPVYGQTVSSQISGQSDAPTLEFTLNYVPSVAAAVEALIADGKTYIIQIDLKNSSTGENAAFYVDGSFASFTVSPNLTDSNQATLTLTTVSDYSGPFTDA